MHPDTPLRVDLQRGHFVVQNEGVQLLFFCSREMVMNFSNETTFHNVYLPLLVSK
jgi:hypothetical protein